MTDEFNPGAGNASTGNVGPLQGEALVQHKALTSNPEWQAAMSGRGGVTARENAMRQLEEVAKLQTPNRQSFGAPGVTAEQFKNDPAAQAALSGKDGPEAQANARRQLDAIEHQEILSGANLSDADAAELDRAHQPVSPLSYKNSIPATEINGIDYGAELRVQLHGAGVSPHAVSAIAAVADEVALGTEAQFFERVDATKDAVMRMAGGPGIIRDAVAYMNALPDGPLALAAELAATVPQGVIEMARLHRAAQRRQKAV